MSLIQLIYVSTATVEYGDEALERLLHSCVKNNQKKQITGMLIYWRGTFMQVLEGSADAVAETYSRIAADSRHHGLILLEKRDIASREFSNWHMGFRKLNDKDALQLEGFVDFFNLRFDPAALNIKKGAALGILRVFGSI